MPTPSRRHTLPAALALVVIALLALPASAATTTIQLQVTADGGLYIDSPADLAVAGPVAGQATSILEQVTVTDQRGGLLGSWTATVAATDLIAGAGGPGQLIDAGHIGYTSGPATTSGVIVAVPGQPTTLQSAPLDQPRTAMSATGVTGTATATWTPTISVNIPAGVAAGTYTATITHTLL